MVDLCGLSRDEEEFKRITGIELRSAALVSAQHVRTSTVRLPPSVLFAFEP